MRDHGIRPKTGVFQQQWRETMRAIVIALSTLLLGAGLLSSTNAQSVDLRRDPPTGGHGGKLNDKYLAGHAGGRLGIDGTKSVLSGVRRHS